MRARELLAIALLAALTSGCSVLSPQPERTRFLLLTATAQGKRRGGPGSGMAALIVGLGPVQLPQYLDRPELVIRTSANGIELSNRDRWAEPLADNVRQVLADDLTAQLGALTIVQYPWYAGTRLEYVVAINIERFDAVSGGGAQLAARWRLTAVKSGEVLVNQQSQLSLQVNPGGGDAIAAALSRALAGLGNQIAQAIAAAEQQHFAQRRG